MRDETEGPATAGRPDDWETLARFLAGESPPAEERAVRAWLAEDPAREEVLEALDSVLGAAAAPPPGLDVEAALRSVHARMDAPEGTPVTPLRRPAPSPRRTTWGAPWLRAAAVAALLLGGLALWRAVAGGGAAAYREALATGVGERDSLRLPDGTHVLLGPASRLAVDEDYGERTRQVRLEGEALFTVPHDDVRPFTVHAGGARVRDLGTVFTVRADSAAGVRVVVTDGAVALSAAEADAAAEVVLREGESGVLDGPASTPSRGASTPGDLAWTRGELVFRDAPLPEVAAALRRWYGVELRASDTAVSGRRLSASFAGEPRERVLSVVALALGAELELRGDTALLRDAAAGAPR